MDEKWCNNASYDTGGAHSEIGVLKLFRLFLLAFHLL